tara:strand:- start:3942 stop:4241 length:300 start_codon:yes stop_codon:yes gene_type:complete
LREWPFKRGGALVFPELVINTGRLALNIYYISQDENTSKETYHAAIVIAKTAGEAREIHPSGDWDRVDVWCYEPKLVTVTYIGKAKRGSASGVVLSSFS